MTTNLRAAIEMLKELRDALADPEAHAFDFRLPIIAEKLDTIIAALKAEQLTEAGRTNFCAMCEEAAKGLALRDEKLRVLVEKWRAREATYDADNEPNDRAPIVIEVCADELQALLPLAGLNTRLI